jgi:hypothetical protein
MNSITFPRDKIPSRFFGALQHNKKKFYCVHIGAALALIAAIQDRIAAKRKPWPDGRRPGQVTELSREISVPR